MRKFCSPTWLCGNFVAAIRLGHYAATERRSISGTDLSPRSMVQIDGGWDLGFWGILGPDEVEDEHPQRQNEPQGPFESVRDLLQANDLKPGDQVQSLGRSNCFPDFHGLADRTNTRERPHVHVGPRRTRGLSVLGVRSGS